MCPPRYAVIANPDSKRWDTYRRELLGFWAARGVTPEVGLVPWADVVPRDGDLAELPAFDYPAVVRLESPGKDVGVTRLLLEAGARDDPSEPTRDWHTLTIPKGLLVRPGLQHRGFCRVLRGLRKSFDERPHLSPTACPLAVAEMFDKAATAEKLTAAGVPVPEYADRIPPTTHFVRMMVHELGWPVAYVKLRTGSSATGIVVLHEDDPFHPYGITTLAEVGSEFYNSRLLRRVTGPDLDRAVEFILSEGAIVQRGIPMAQIDGQNFDVRVVCVYGKPVCSIFRLSPHPMTNLHLGGRRGDWEYCRAAIPTREWLDALDHCSEAAGCFDSTIAGVDLLFERGYRRHYILEVNAFGDFFPGWLDRSGQSVHSHEIEATANRSGFL